MPTAETTLTMRTLRQMVTSMLRIYPPLEERINGFETLVAQHFKDQDVIALKNVIIHALETMRKADLRELQEVSKLKHIDERTKRRLDAILGLIQLQIAKLKALEAGIQEYEKTPSPALTQAINRLKEELAGLLRREERELAEAAGEAA